MRIVQLSFLSGNQLPAHASWQGKGNIDYCCLANCHCHRFRVQGPWSMAHALHDSWSQSNIVGCQWQISRRAISLNLVELATIASSSGQLGAKKRFSSLLRHFESSQSMFWFSMQHMVHITKSLELISLASCTAGAAEAEAGLWFAAVDIAGRKGLERFVHCRGLGLCMHSKSKGQGSRSTVHKQNPKRIGYVLLHSSYRNKWVAQNQSKYT